MRRILKPVVALTAGLALLVLSAGPGAATTGTTTGGTITVNLTPTLTAPMAGTGTSTCAGGGLNVVTTSTTAGTATITLQSEFTYQTGQYVLQGSGTAAITFGATTVNVASVVLTGVNIYNVSGSCVIGTAKCGSISANFATGLSGTWSGTVSPPGLTGTAVLAGSAAIAAGGCTPPFSALNGKTATITGWTVVF